MDESFMHDCMLRCLQLAERGRRSVGNGAKVGAVLVRGGKIIAEAFHREFGATHAERELLQKFDQNIQQEDVLIVNLEPCSHYGKTPPCIDIILERGIRNIVYGMVDPDQRASGKGIEYLLSKGVTVVGPIARTKCERLNRGFVRVRTKGRPWITLKMAKDRAGSISNPDGTPKKITNQEQDIWSHTNLRDQADGVLIGVQTVLNDDPKLDTRFAQKFQGDLAEDKNETIKIPLPCRIVLDPQLRIPYTAKVVTDENRSRTIIICGQSADRSKAESLSRNDVKVFPIPIENGQFVWSELWSAVLTPTYGYPGLTSILVEGGHRTWDIFRKAGFVDEEVTLIGAE